VRLARMIPLHRSCCPNLLSQELRSSLVIPRLRDASLASRLAEESVVPSLPFLSGRSRLTTLLLALCSLASVHAGGAGSGDLLGGLEEARLETGFEALASRDIRVTDGTVTGRLRDEAWDVEVQGTRADIWAGYQNAVAVDPLGYRRDLAEHRHAGQGTLRVRPDARWTLHASGGGYLGYTDYRSLWLNEYYRQRFGPLIGYREAHPAGWNASAGGRWAARPGDRFLQWDVLWQGDTVAPAYEKFPFQPLIRRQDHLDTRGFRLGGEGILGRRLRGLVEGQVLWTTERRPRLSLRQSLNWAVDEAWVARFTTAMTLESPRYVSGSAGVLVERELPLGWFVGIDLRYYHDNGQLNQSLPESTASPGLRTIQTAMVARWQGETWGVKASIGPYLNDYDEVTSKLNPFVHLYRDRTWVGVQVAAGRVF